MGTAWRPSCRRLLTTRRCVSFSSVLRWRWRASAPARCVVSVGGGIARFHFRLNCLCSVFMCVFRTHAGFSYEFRCTWGGVELVSLHAARSAQIIAAEVANGALYAVTERSVGLLTSHTTSFRRGNDSQCNAAPRAALAACARSPSRRTAAASSCARSPSKTDWRNGSASDSSPEGYAFESRIGH